MSGIAGIMSRDGAPVDTAAVRRMADAIDFRGSARLGEWHNGTVALAHRLFITTPEAAGEHQPLTDEGGRLALVFDGRVDNRDELRVEFQRAALPLRDNTDPELVLRGYQLWADDLPGRLLGDFAFAIWDEAQQRVFCARDLIGAKPFYFFCDGHEFIFASELIALVRSQRIGLHPDEAFIAELLRDTVYGHTRTLLRGVRRLPGAHALVVTAETERISRYWSPENIPQIRYCRRAEYTEHARAVLEQSVAARLRACGPVACDLSGGLDSSTITALADHLRRTGRVATPIFASSVVFPGMECDESRYIDDIVARTCIESVRSIWTQDQAAPDWRTEVQQTAELPSHPTIWTDALARIAAGGAHVSLVGIGGDEWFAGNESSLADMFTHFRWRELLQQFGSGHVQHNLRSAVRGLVPEWLRARTRPWRGVGDVSAPWVSSHLLAQADPDLQLRAMWDFRLPERAQREVASLGFHGYPARARDVLELAQARFGIEPRYPFHDRRVIEFSLGVPGEELWNRGVSKFALRNAMAGLLPESIAMRPDKAEFTTNVLKRLLDWSDLSRDMHVVSRGWVHYTVIQAMLERVLRGQEYEAFHREMGALCLVLALEAWDRIMSLP